MLKYFQPTEPENEVGFDVCGRFHAENALRWAAVFWAIKIEKLDLYFGLTIFITGILNTWAVLIFADSTNRHGVCEGNVSFNIFQL